MLLLRVRQAVSVRHAQCEEYREYLKSNAEKRNAHLKERLALQGYSEHVARCIERRNRKKRQ